MTQLPSPDTARQPMTVPLPKPAVIWKRSLQWEWNSGGRRDWPKREGKGWGPEGFRKG